MTSSSWPNALGKTTLRPDAPEQRGPEDGDAK